MNTTPKANAWLAGFDPDGRLSRLRAQGEAQAALTTAALAFFAMEFEGAPHPPAEQVRADFAAAVHGYRAAVAR